MIFMGRFRIINEAKKEFEWIKNAKLNESEKLNELVDLRNYLKETFLLMEKVKEDYPNFYKDLTILVSEIDKYWWKMFTGGKTG